MDLGEIILLLVGGLFIVGFVWTILINPFFEMGKHQKFCESINLKFDGYPSGEFYGVKAITCTGITPDNKAIIKHFLIKNEKYYEVEK